MLDQVARQNLRQGSPEEDRTDKRLRSSEAARLRGSSHENRMPDDLLRKNCFTGSSS